MPKLKLDLSDDEGDNVDLKINKNYADRYDNWRRLEEVQKLKDKYGSDMESDSDESTSSEDRAEWTTEHEKSFLRTLAALKTHNPIVYKSEERFFSPVPSTSSETQPFVETGVKKKQKKEEPMYLKDYERKLIIERGGDISDEDEQNNIEITPGYYARQEKLKAEFKMAAANIVEDDANEPLLTRRIKTKDELKKEEDEYYEWLKGQRKDDIADSEKLRGLRDIWRDQKLDDDEKFLRDYLLDKKYEVEDDGNNVIPTYDEIVNVEEDEKELDRERNFEEKYNFRFEEPDKEFIKQYPRTVRDSMRKPDERRKAKRDAHKERKEAEKKKKKSEIRELKMLKKKEIEDKLERLRQMAGDEKLAVKMEDLEEDFDPTEYDKRMKELFNADYYDGCAEDEKPEFPEASNDESDDDSNYEDLELRTGDETEEKVQDTCGDEPQSGDNQRCREKEPSKRRKKRNSRFLEAVLKKKPLFNPAEKTFEEYFNEYYSLDYEDIIGDGTITKFKYRKVPANNFGLTAEEILKADDRQLNAWASLKKVTAYRSEAEEKYDIQAYEKKAKNFEKKKRIFSTDFGGEKSKKVTAKLHDERSNQRLSDESLEQKPAPSERRTKMDESGKKRRRKKKRLHAVGEISNTKNIMENDDRLRAYGINPKKFRNHQRYDKNVHPTSRSCALRDAI
ncbi:hypothetical protein AB6A40_004502 [Gnathostoma spinigerum]|uniref:Protein KRI1 homolog n=1 Tax=Gnathostoma spinigerum TaxID=75299 RepID=A0ABD6ECU7_9BILA